MGPEDYGITIWDMLARIPRPTEYEDHTGKIHKIRFVKKLKENGDNISGMNDNGLISIDSSRSLYWQARTLFHELIHQAQEDLVFIDPTAGWEELITMTIDNNFGGGIWEKNPMIILWITYHLANGKSTTQTR